MGSIDATYRQRTPRSAAPATWAETEVAAQVADGLAPVAATG